VVGCFLVYTATVEEVGFDECWLSRHVCSRFGGGWLARGERGEEKGGFMTDGR
jgi:hypothetical protein